MTASRSMASHLLFVLRVLLSRSETEAVTLDGEEIFDLVERVTRSSSRTDETLLDLLILAAEAEPRFRVALDEVVGIVLDVDTLEPLSNRLLEYALEKGDVLLGLVQNEIEGQGKAK